MNLNGLLVIPRVDNVYNEKGQWMVTNKLTANGPGRENLLISSLRMDTEEERRLLEERLLSV